MYSEIESAMEVHVSFLTALTVKRVPPWHLPISECDCVERWQITIINSVFDSVSVLFDCGIGIKLSVIQFSSSVQVNSGCACAWVVEVVPIAVSTIT
jgi:hypothetical protein